MSSHAVPCKPSVRSETLEVTRAKEILRSHEAEVAEVIDLAGRLREASKFDLARRLYSTAREIGATDAAQDREIRQRLTLCTYKDPDLPTDHRLSRALEILQEGEDLSTTTDPETLGLAGAIYKRRWEVDAQKVNLERAFAYYLRGYRQGPEKDQGWTGINAAFVLDQLASLEEREAGNAGIESEIARTRREHAAGIRQALIDVLPALPKAEGRGWLKGKWWFYATIAEAHFGLGEYAEAYRWIERGMKLENVPEWEYRSTAMQLAALANLDRDSKQDVRDFERSDATRVLNLLLKDRAAGVRSAYIGKVGLGLSGGGFRASLFHIGVLAKLAELDILRHVEVLSCVSGGSILGAHYYLELKQLLEHKADEEIGREDYIELVRRLEQDFLNGVQKNIRMRVVGELTTNLKMIFIPGYSRTMRAGELYERWLYSEVKDGRGNQSRWLTDLYIRPGDDDDFKPRNDNWCRQAKVPDLILNATTLNTGHSWQFTASWMGEPPAAINTEVDANYTLRRMYYWEAPDEHKCVRLGYAVAASACVPGIFEPLTLKGLYDDIDVKLVDGGVHDNQGIVGLIEEDCTVVLISDASGQMGTQDNPSSGLLGVPLRSNSILQSRIRSEQYDDLTARCRSGLLRGMMYIHLKKDLDDDPRDWVNCRDPHDVSADSRRTSDRGPLTSYGIQRHIQAKLAEIRTDLDSFSDGEAFALMTSGYRMTEHAFRHEESLRRLPVHDGPAEKWRFLSVDDLMTEANEESRFARLLSVGSKKAFKAWRLLKPLQVLALVLGVLAVAGLVWLVLAYWDTSLLTVSAVGMTAAAGLGTVVLGKWVMRIVQFRSTLQHIAIGIGLAVAGWIIAKIHVYTTDRLYLRLGREHRVRIGSRD